jgi:heat shock protein HtpX
MVVMTIAQLVPLIAYYIYRTVTDSKSDSKHNRGLQSLVGFLAYAVYAVAQVIVLWFSRTREYYADEFAAETTNEPNALSSALIKIGYGLAKQPGASSSVSSSRGAAANLSAFNIFDKRSANGLVLASQTGLEDHHFSPDQIRAALRWDRWNPWALVFELLSTHPLIAKRLERLAQMASQRGQIPLAIFDEKKPESYWDEFIADLITHVLPTITFLSTLGLTLFYATNREFNPNWLGISVTAWGVATLVKTKRSYREDGFKETEIANLLGEVKVSPIRPIPATLRGTIIGKGIPGLIWSEDFILRDQSGIVLVDYRQPLRAWEFLFGLFRASSYQGRTIEARGWYRRGPIPYLELASITDLSDNKTRRCYVKTIKNAIGLVATLIGVLILKTRW